MIIDSKIASYFICEPPLYIYSRQQKACERSCHKNHTSTFAFLKRMSANKQRSLSLAPGPLVLHHPWGKDRKEGLRAPSPATPQLPRRRQISFEPSCALSAHCWSAGSCTLDHFTRVFLHLCFLLPDQSLIISPKPPSARPLLWLIGCQEKRLQKGLWECESVCILVCAWACECVRAYRRMHSSRCMCKYWVHLKLTIEEKQPPNAMQP